MTFLHRFLRDESGATAIEYSLIAGFIALIIIGSLRTIGQQLVPKFQGVSNGLS